MFKSTAMGLALLCILGTHPSSAAECHLKSLGSLDLQIAPGGQILVPVSLNGTDAWMTLHTALAFTMVTDATITAFDLKRQPISSLVEFTSGDKRMAYQVTVALFKLGNVSYRNTTFAVSPGTDSAPPPTYLDRPMIGYLGVNAFDNVDFELNLAAKKMILYSQDHCPGNVVYWTRNYTEIPFRKGGLGTIVFPIELDGTKVLSTFATGNPVTVIDSNITRRVYGFDENSPDITRESSADGSDDGRFRAMALTAPGLNITNTPVRLIAGEKECGQAWRKSRDEKAVDYAHCGGKTPLRLGVNVMTKLRIYVSTKEKIIYASRADAT